MTVVVHAPARKWTVEEFNRMADLGLLQPGERVELIEGEIVEMAPIGSRHAGMVNILLGLFSRAAANLAVVSVQNPLIVGDRSVPQPDLALLKPRADSYMRSHPTAADVLLVVEVADTTLDFDVGTKVPLYARVPEVWVIDLQEQAVRVYREPSASGYKSSFTAARDESVAPLALPEVRVGLSALFP